MDDSEQKHLERKRAWVGRYNDQNANRELYDDDGNVYTYDHNHRFEDGDGPRQSRPAPSSSFDEQFYRQNNASSSQSIRRIRSRASFSSRNDDMAPGAGEAERRRAKNKSRTRGLLGSRKNKSDRHARSEQVMESDYNHRNPYDDDSLQSLGDSSAEYRRPSYGDGPENADDTIGKQYARQKRQPEDASPRHDVDIMNANHQF